MANNVIAGTGTSGATALPVAVSIDGVNDYLPIYTASATATQAINRNILLGLTSGPVGLTDSQAVTNKTFGNTNTVTLKDTLFTLQDDGDTTKQARFQLSGLTTATTRTYTLPDITDTMVTLTATQTLTNKTLTSPTISAPTITNATISADALTGFTVSNNGTVYGMSVTGGVLASAALLNTVNTAALQTNAVGAANIATNAITLGYTQITSGFSTASATPVQVTGLTATVTIPAGGRKVKITVWAQGVTNTNTTTNTATLWSGTVGSGTQLAAKLAYTATATGSTDTTIIFVHTPVAGSITYNVGLATAAGTATWSAGATSPSFILVEAI